MQERSMLDAFREAEAFLEPHRQAFARGAVVLVGVPPVREFHGLWVNTRDGRVWVPAHKNPPDLVDTVTTPG